VVASCGTVFWCRRWWVRALPRSYVDFPDVASFFLFSLHLFFFSPHFSLFPLIFLFFFSFLFPPHFSLFPSLLSFPPHFFSCPHFSLIPLISFFPHFSLYLPLNPYHPKSTLTLLCHTYHSLLFIWLEPCNPNLVNVSTTFNDIHSYFGMLYENTVDPR